MRPPINLAKVPAVISYISASGLWRKCITMPAYGSLRGGASAVEGHGRLLHRRRQLHITALLGATEIDTAIRRGCEKGGGLAGTSADATICDTTALRPLKGL